MRRRLPAWYRHHARPMPWRGTRDPYRIWVSEAMLQQTQVATATPYYRRFLARFPTLESLAAAPPARVLEAWAGLGYYRRARHLHEAARTVVREHGGRVPDSAEAFGALPGVGRYTTAAVLSIAFDRPLAVLDGNVARVLARLAARPWSVRDPAGARHLWDLAQSLVPMRRPGDWNQAVMELGATVCLPRAPRCGACPVAAACRARAAGRPGAFPPAAPRRPPERVRRAIALVSRGGRWLVARRDGSLLDGLWEPPGADLAGGAGAADAAAALRAALRALGLTARLEPHGAVLRHVITHRRIEAEVWRGRVTGRARAAARWVDPARPGVPLSALGRRALALAEAAGSGHGAGPRRTPRRRG